MTTMLRIVSAAVLSVISGCSPGNGDEHIVCAEYADGCDHVGNRALQAAVDAATDGDTIRVRAGRYSAEGTRDVSHNDVIVRGYVVVDGKSLDIVAEGPVLLRGGNRSPSSALVVTNSSVKIDGIEIDGFFAALPDDQIYDGHGIFVINSEVDIVGTSLRKIEKMAVSVFGNSSVTVTGSEALDGHVGVWVEDDSRLTVRSCIFRNNDSAGIAAYLSSSVIVSDSIFEENLDDAIYAADHATITVSDSSFARNRPFAIRSVDDARITVATSRFVDNEQDRFMPDGD